MKRTTRNVGVISLTAFALALLILYGRQQSPEESMIQSNPVLPAVGVFEDSADSTSDSAENGANVGGNSELEQQDPKSDLFVAPSAHPQSDEEILESVRVNATEIFLEQASWTLPKSFHESGLAPADKEKLTVQWASASGACLAEALEKYSKTTETPLAEMMNDDESFSLKGDGFLPEYHLSVETCIERAWEAIGASPP